MSTPKSKPAKARRKRTKGGKANRRSERALAGIARAARREETAQEQARLKLAARERRVIQEQADRAAAERRRRAEQRDRDRNRQRWTILDLLRRGAGVTQILQTIAEPADTPSDSLRRAQQLHRILEQTGSSPSDTGGLQIKPRKLTRTLNYLDRELAWMQNAATNTASRYVSPLAYAA